MDSPGGISSILSEDSEGETPIVRSHRAPTSKTRKRPRPVLSDSGESDSGATPGGSAPGESDSGATPGGSAAREQDTVTGADVMEELKSNSELLKYLVKCVKKQEKRIKAVENEVKRTTPAAGSTTPGSTPTRKREVPDEVRVSYVTVDMKWLA